MKKFNYTLVMAVLASVLTMGCRQNNSKLHVTDENGAIEIDNGLIKARFAVKNNLVTQEYFAKKNEDWLLVAESFRPVAPVSKNPTMLFNSSLDPKHRFW
jgi:hypothetical protein